jgi:hypothetical protein
MTFTLEFGRWRGVGFTSRLGWELRLGWIVVAALRGSLAAHLRQVNATLCDLRNRAMAMNAAQRLGLCPELDAAVAAWKADRARRIADGVNQDRRP